MRTLIAIALVASAGFATLAQAQTPASDPSSVRIKGVPTARHLITEEQFQDIGGVYMLSNGKRLTVSSNNYHYFAQIQGQREVEIYPTATKQFIASNGDMQVDFDEWRGDHTSDVVVRTGLRSNNVAMLESR